MSQIGISIMYLRYEKISLISTAKVRTIFDIEYTCFYVMQHKNGAFGSFSALFVRNYSLERQRSLKS